MILGRIHQVDYEETVADFEGTSLRPAAAGGLHSHPACLQFHNSETARPDRELRAGAPAGLLELGRPLEALSR